MRLFKKRKTVDYVYIGRRKVWYRIPNRGDTQVWAFADENCTRVALNENGYHIMFSVRELIGMEKWPDFLGRDVRVKKVIEKTYMR